MELKFRAVKMKERTKVPVYTFRVDLIDHEALASQTLPNSMENILLNLRSATVHVPFVNRALKHGDEFTLCGSQAIRVYSEYINKKPQVLVLA